MSGAATRVRRKRKHSVSDIDSPRPIPCPPVAGHTPASDEGAHSELMDVDAAKAEDTALDDSWRTSWNATFDVLAESVRENPANVFSGGVDAEPAERVWWESEQWNNVRTFATRAMRAGERRDMLLDEAHEERLSMNPVSWRATDAMKDVYLYDWERMRLKERMATMVTGATEMTRARARIRRLDQRIREAVDRYRVASYEALLEARHPGLQRDWNGMEYID
ncbi:hypothetical protein FB451DRAFT_1407137 [Mycena latifolia]|nr:hypothetical protein FB451DRAFT_1407137 [Mycena latifolia]